MKKKLLILAVVGLALAACSSDETVASQATSEVNAISFRPLMNGITRTTDLTSAGLQSLGFKVFANVGSTTTNYFPETLFSYDNGTYTSTTKYY